MESNEMLEMRLKEALEKLETLEVGSKERESLIKEIEALQQAKTAQYRAEVDAYDKQEEIRLKEEEINAGKKRTIAEFLKIAAMAGISLLEIFRVLEIEKESTVHSKAFNLLPRGKLW